MAIRITIENVDRIDDDLLVDANLRISEIIVMKFPRAP